MLQYHWIIYSLNFNIIFNYLLISFSIACGQWGISSAHAYMLILRATIGWSFSDFLCSVSAYVMGGQTFSLLCYFPTINVGLRATADDLILMDNQKEKMYPTN